MNPINPATIFESFFLNYFQYTSIGCALGIVTIFFIVLKYKNHFTSSFAIVKESLPGRTLQKEATLKHFLLFVGIFLTVLLVRLYSAKLMYGSWFIQDDAFDSCIDPFQLLLGENIWGGGTNYLTYIFYLLAYKIFGYSLIVSYSVNVVIFSLSLAVLSYATYKQFGLIASTVVLLVCITSYPFILHSIYATALTFSFLPVALMLLSFSYKNSFFSAAFLIFCLFLSLFLYPGAFLTGICLLFFHIIFFTRWWTLKTVTGALASFLVMGPFTLVVRNFSSSNSRLSHWAGGNFSFHNFLEKIVVVLQDTFWKSTTWNTLNYNVPYFEPPLLFLLISAVFLLLFSIKYKSFSFAEKWICVFVLTYLGSTTLSAFSGQYPGVRRVISSLPLLYIICGISLQKFLDLKIARGVVLIATVIGITLIAGRSYFITQNKWPLTHKSAFMEESSRLLAKTEKQVQKVIIASYRGDQFQAQHYRCALGLDQNYQQQFSPPLIIPRNSFNRPLVEINPEDSFVFLANENFDENQLLKAFGRKPDASYSFQQTERPRPDLLVEAHVFARDQEPILIEATSALLGPSDNIKISSYVSGGGAIQYLTPLKGLRPYIEFKTQVLRIPATRSEIKTVEGFSLGASDNLRLLFTGQWEAQGAENIIFQIQADDGCRLMINGKVIVDYEGVHAFSSFIQSRPVRLDTGRHEIVLDYFEWGGEAGLTVSWAPIGGEFLPLRSGQLLP